MKKIIFLFIFAFSLNAQAAYQYSYIPKESKVKIHNFLSRSWKKCRIGEKNDYPKKKGACITCPKGTGYFVNTVKEKGACYQCPKGTLLVSKNGYPMCISNYPVVDGKALTDKGEPVPLIELERLALSLNSNYKKRLFVEEDNEKETYDNKEKLVNICPFSFPKNEQNPEALKQIAICKKLAQENDFLCPYVEKGVNGKWECHACPENTPYKNRQGGCFTCPYGEGKITLKSGEKVCASVATKH